MSLIQSFFNGKIRVSLLLFFLSFIAFTCNFRYIPSGDTLPAELLPISLIHEHDLDFNEFVENIDKLEYYYRNINGRVVSSYPIIPGIFNTPVYFAAYLAGIDLLGNTFPLSMITSAIIASFSVILLYGCLLKICKNSITSFFFALIYVFATAVWSVACRSIWQHGPSLLLITISLFLILSKKQSWLSLSGFFLGLAVFNRPTNILIALPITVYIFFHHRKAMLKFLVLSLIPAFFLLAYSTFYWGDLLSLGQVQGGTGFDGRFFEGIAGLLISPSRGLLVFSPIFVFSIFSAIVVLFNKNTDPLYKYLSVSMILFILLYSKWGMWWGGWTYGYRLLIEIVPVLIIFLSLFWKDVLSKSFYLKGLFGVLLAFSIYVHFLGAFCYPAGFNESPNNIDQHPERLWSVRDGQIIRCHNKIFKRVKQVFIK